MGPQRLVTFVISALEMFLLTYLLTAIQIFKQLNAVLARPAKYQLQTIKSR